jgi:hypothetical protein
MSLFTQATQDLTGAYVVAYGPHVVAGNVVMKATEGSGDDMRTTLVVLLGEGVWWRIRSAYWNGGEIPLADIHFHQGELSESMAEATLKPDGSWTQGVDPWNAGGLTYSGTAYAVVKLPVGAEVDGDDYSGLKFICECMQVPDYDADGNEIGFGYTTNPARIDADILLRWRGLPKSRIDWTSWVAYRDFCDVQLDWVGGEMPVRPTYNVVNLSQTANAGLIKTTGGSSWNGHGTTNFAIPMGVDGYHEVDNGSGRHIIGLTYTANVTSHVQVDFAVYLDWAANKVYMFRNDVLSLTPWPYREGETWRVGLENGVGYVTRNGVRMNYEAYGGQFVQAAPMYGSVSLYAVGDDSIRATFSPLGGTTRTRPRFEAGLAFPNGTDAMAAHESVMLVSCTNIQDVDGKVKYVLPSMAGNVRPSVFDFDMSNIVGEFKDYRLARGDRPTSMKLEFRNKDSAVLAEDDPVDISRDALRDLLNGRENPMPPVHVGTCTRGQVQCVGNYQMRLASDLDLFARFRADGTSWRVMPGDIVRVSHDVPGWSLVRCMVVSVIDHSSTDTADERTFVVQAVPEAIYSDTDHTPLSIRVETVTPSGLVAPPIGSITSLLVVSGVNPNRTYNMALRGSFAFNTRDYPHMQRARVYIKEGTGPYRITDVVLDVSRTDFEIFLLHGGLYTVKVVTESQYGYADHALPHAETSVTVVGDTFELPPPSDFVGTFGVDSVQYRWNPPSDPSRVKEYQIWSSQDTTNPANMIWSGVSLSYTEQFGAGAPASVTRWLRAVDYMGNFSPWVALNAGTPIVVVDLPAVDTWTVTFDPYTGSLLHDWVPLPPEHRVRFYQIATDPDFGDIVIQTQANTVAERVGNSSRSFVRYLRAVSYTGAFGDPVMRTVNFSVLSAPTVALLAQYPSSAVIGITPHASTDPAQIVRTVVQIGTAADFSVLVGPQIEIPGYQTQVSVSAASGLKYVRVRYDDAFGAGAWSSPGLAVTFAGVTAEDIGLGTITAAHLVNGAIGAAQLAIGAIRDQHVDTNSAFARQIVGRSQLPLHGGGDLTWDGTTFTMTQRITAMPVSLTIGKDGFFEFG